MIKQQKDRQRDPQTLTIENFCCSGEKHFSKILLESGAGVWGFTVEVLEWLTDGIEVSACWVVGVAGSLIFLVVSSCWVVSSSPDTEIIFVVFASFFVPFCLEFTFAATK